MVFSAVTVSTFFYSCLTTEILNVTGTTVSFSKQFGVVVLSVRWLVEGTGVKGYRGEGQ